MWDVYILGKNGSSFNLSVLSSGFHSLGVLSWQVPVVTKWWVLRWAVHWILGLPQLLGLSPGQLSPACPRQTPDAGWLCPLQMQKQDLSSILCASLHTTYSPAKKILIPVESSLDIRQYMQCRCTGDYTWHKTRRNYLIKLNRKNWERLSKLHANEYIPIIIFFKSCFICSP